MTVVATYQHQTGGLLIADALLTGDIAKAKAPPAIEIPSIDLPNVANVNARPLLGGKYVAGLRQKVVVISPRLAVAWAGIFDDAAQVIRRIKNAHFSGPAHEMVPRAMGVLQEAAQAAAFRPAAEKTVFSLLAYHEPAKGWLVAGPTQYWRYPSPEERTRLDVERNIVNLGAFGSGAALALEHIADTPIRSSAAAHALEWTGRVLSQSEYEQNALEHLIGGAFQIVYVDQDRPILQRLSSYLSIFCEARLRDGREEIGVIAATRTEYVGDTMQVSGGLVGRPPRVWPIRCTTDVRDYEDVQKEMEGFPPPRMDMGLSMIGLFVRIVRDDGASLGVVSGVYAGKHEIAQAPFELDVRDDGAWAVVPKPTWDSDVLPPIMKIRANLSR